MKKILTILFLILSANIFAQTPTTPNYVVKSINGTPVDSTGNVNIATGGSGGSADSLKKLPVDTSANTSGYVLAFDASLHKWYLKKDSIGSGTSQWVSLASDIYFSAGKVNIGSGIIGTATLNVKDSLLAASGSLAGSALSVSQTWNTSGNPSMIYGNATNTASGGLARLIDLRVANAQKFYVDYTGASYSTSGIFLNGGNFGITQASNVVYVKGLPPSSGYSFNIYSTSAFAPTSGQVGVQNLSFSTTFNPTSGTAEFDNTNISPIINQTGGALGITRSLYINPTLTSAYDYRAIEMTNNTGHGIYQSGTADNIFWGKLKYNTKRTFTDSTGSDSNTVITVAGAQRLVSGGSSGTTTNAVTFNSAGSGDASGTTFDGSAARTISYNTLGAAPLASPALTGTPTAPTPATTDSSTKIATTAFVQSNLASEFTFQYGIGSGVDLDSITTTGWYYQGSDANAASGTNYPVPYAGKLEVWNANGSLFIYQYYHTTGSYNTIYYRTLLASSWSAWSTVAPIYSPALTGTPTAPTPATTDSSTKIATTAFVKKMILDSTSIFVVAPVKSDTTTNPGHVTISIDTANMPGLRPYKVYTAIVNQTGTSAPTVTVLENTTGATFTWSYVGVGSYKTTASSSILTSNKTTITVQNGSTVTPVVLPVADWESGSIAGIKVKQTSDGTSVDSVLTSSIFEIRIYP